LRLLSRTFRSLMLSFGNEAVPYSIFSPPSLGRAPLRMCKRLHLHLDFPEDLASEPTGELRELSQLEHVSAPLSMLIGTPDEVDITISSPLHILLPRWLVSLGVWIDDCWETTLKMTGVQMFVELFESKRDKSTSYALVVALRVQIWRASMWRRM
jgi:hypothetical protein